MIALQNLCSRVKISCKSAILKTQTADSDRQLAQHLKGMNFRISVFCQVVQRH